MTASKQSQDETAKIKKIDVLGPSILQILKEAIYVYGFGTLVLSPLLR
jgi:hypothetical protein